VSNLNKEQLLAANYFTGPLLILAGAGAGKTKTLVARIVNLIKNGTAPDKILAITFTNKAAAEMRERVGKELASNSELNLPVSLEGRPFISTFHALGVYIIRENAHELSLSKHFKIFDRDDSKKAVREALKDLGFDPKEFEPGKILSIISREKGAAVNQSAYALTVENDYTGSVIARVWEKYERTLKEEGALDFDDLLTKTLILLYKKEILDKYLDKWTYIHIDEYQDTNVAQYKIANILSSKHLNLCVVGDIDQNIYSWRGARLKNILDFERDYPGAKIIILEENYRSTKTILDAANIVIEKNKWRKEKKLFTNKAGGEPISLYEGFDEVSEAEFITTKAEGLIAGGVKPEEIAVLYRANFQSRVLEEAFISYGVKYQLLGTKFFERKEVKDVIAYLRAALDRKNISDIKRIINVPVRGIGKVSFLKIVEGKTESLPEKIKRSYEDFKSLLNQLEKIAQTEKPSDVIKFILKKSGIEDEFSSEGEDERLENVRELVTIASRYDTSPGLPGIEEFITNASLQSDQDELKDDKGGVRLMTIHAAKGLEFDYVFISGLEDGLFPHQRITKSVHPEDDEEERRLCYVALTRARKKLFLSYAQTRTVFGTRQVNIPSEFLYDIPEESIVREEGTFGLLRKPLLNIDF
jgi:DNA helicase-2/ATP-dependent DNA helicase PcrA